MLVRYELSKILRRKSTWLVMSVSLIITALLFSLPIFQYQYYTEDGVVCGLEGIRKEKEQYISLERPLTDSYIQGIISEIQTLFEDEEQLGFDGSKEILIGDAYWKSIAPREALLNLIAKNYAEPNQSADYTALADLDISEIADFYQARTEKIEKILNDSGNALSEEEKSYWRKLYNQSDVPWQYGYYEGWKTIISSFELLIFAILSVCITIAPVFAGEYQSGMDVLLHSAKFGRTKLPAVKMIAAYLFATFAFTLHVLLAFMLPLTAFGIDGWNLPIQIANTVIPYPLTFLQAVLVNLGVVYLLMFAMTALTLFLSSQMKNPHLVLGVIVAVLFIPMFLSPNGSTGTYNLILFLLPYRSIIAELSKYISYSFGNCIMDVWAMRAILYALLNIIFLLCTKRGLKRRQTM